MFVLEVFSLEEWFDTLFLHSEYWTGHDVVLLANEIP